MSGLDRVLKMYGKMNVTDKNGREYVVQEVNKWDFGINQHYECVLERYNPEDRE